MNDNLSASGRNYILRSPYEAPAEHWELDDHGRMTDAPPQSGRRPSTSLSGMPTTESSGVTESLIVDDFCEQPHRIINELREVLADWRVREWEGVTSRTRKLLEFWAGDSSAMRPFWCQLEAIETVIWLLEAGPKVARERNQGFMGYLHEENRKWNRGIPRVALKMATGTGKTNLMAMTALWWTANRQGPVDFLVIAPNLTVRERLEALRPDKRDELWEFVAPRGFERDLCRMRWSILNFQAFQRRFVLGVNGNEQADGKVKKFLMAGQKEQPEGWTESEEAMLARLLRANRGRNEIVVMNDEAHHCYDFDRKVKLEGKADAEEKEERKRGALWFEAIRALHDARRLQQVFDFSATPMWLRKPAYLTSPIFPWTVTDFSLLDAIESGLVKIPRVPVGDNVSSQQPKFRNIYEYNDGRKLGEALSAKMQEPLRRLYEHYSEESLYTGKERSFLCSLLWRTRFRMRRLFINGWQAIKMKRAFGNLGILTCFPTSPQKADRNHIHQRFLSIRNFLTRII